MDKGTCNLVPVPLARNFGDSMHFDIGYGVKHGLDGVKYSILFVDRATKYDFLYPLRNFTTDLIAAVKQLIADMGFAPKCVIADFEMKLICSAMKEFFTKKGTIVEASPPSPNHQQQNGLVQRH
eukprot:15155136-Ditylum_brightwellii.AAC.1